MDEDHGRGAGTGTNNRKEEKRDGEGGGRVAAHRQRRAHVTGRNKKNNARRISQQWGGILRNTEEGMHDAATPTEGRKHKPTGKGTTKKRGKINNNHVTHKNDRNRKSGDGGVRRTNMVQAHGDKQMQRTNKEETGSGEEGKTGSPKEEKKGERKTMTGKRRPLVPIPLRTRQKSLGCG
jgi:hypothetical protein